MVEMLEFLDHSKKSHPSHLQTTKEVLELSIHLVFKIQERPQNRSLAREYYIFSVKMLVLDSEAYSSLISLFSVICQDALVKPNHLHNAAGLACVLAA